MRTPPVRRGASLVVLLTIGGCGIGAATDDGVVIRDSAGVEIVESSAPRWRAGESWRVADTPSVTIGAVFGDDPATQFTRIVGATRLGDGRIVVADGGSAELRFFDATGRHLQSVGGKGSGPGEFVRLTGLLRLAGDSLLAIQAMPPKQSLFSDTGAFVRLVETPAAPDALLPHVASAILDDGTAVLAPGARPVMRFTGTRRDSITIFTAAPGEDSARLLGTFPSMNISGNGRFIAPVAFAPVGVRAARGDRFYAGYAERFEITVHSKDGALQRLIRREWTATPVSQEARDAHIEMLSRGTPESFRQEFLKALTFAEHFPAYDDLLVDATGRLWVRAAPTDGTELRMPEGLAAHAARWSIFDHDGGWLGDVRMPMGFDVLEVGTDYALGVWYDESEIPFVRLYPLIKE